MPGKWSAWRYFNKKSGRWFRKWREPGSRKLYSQIEARWLWERDHGPIPEGYEVHHKNLDHGDNSLDNLELVTAEWHDNYHQRLQEDHQVIDGVECRRCQRCEEYRPLGQFKPRSAGTYQGYCGDCQLEYLREWRGRNREHHNAYMREYRRKRKAAGDA
jgi:hypothetical protein